MVGLLAAFPLLKRVFLRGKVLGRLLVDVCKRADRFDVEASPISLFEAYVLSVQMLILTGGDVRVERAGCWYPVRRIEASAQWLCVTYFNPKSSCERLMMVSALTPLRVSFVDVWQDTEGFFQCGDGWVGRAEGKEVR